MQAKKTFARGAAIRLRRRAILSNRLPPIMKHTPTGDKLQTDRTLVFAVRESPPTRITLFPGFTPPISSYAQWAGDVFLLVIDPQA